MKTQTLLLVAGAVGVGYYLYKKQQATSAVPLQVAIPVTPTATADDEEQENSNNSYYMDDGGGSAVSYGWQPNWGALATRRRGHGNGAR